MKKLLIPLLVVVAVVFALSKAPDLLRPWVSQKIAEAMPGTKVSIGSISGSLVSDITLSHIAIEDAYSKISFEAATLNYTLPGLFRKSIDQLSLQKGEAIYHSVGHPMPVISYGSDSSGAPVKLSKLAISDLKLDIETQDMTLNGKISFVRDLELNKFEDASITLPKLRLGTIMIKDLNSKVNYAQRGKLTIRQVAFQKWNMDDIQIDLELRNDKLGIRLDSALWLGITLTGAGEVRFAPSPSYAFKIEITALPISRILTTYEWDKKLSVSGQLGGTLEIEGTGARITTLKGVLRNATDGNIVILDQAFLQRIADSAKQPIEIIKATFENYHYNTGEVAVSLDDQNIRLGIDLNGEAGKRNLEVYLHDLF
jgi:hypothetical protein